MRHRPSRGAARSDWTVRGAGEMASAFAGRGDGLGDVEVPVPGQEFVKARGRVVVDAVAHVGEPSSRVDVVELFGLGQDVSDGGAPAASVGAGESLVTSSQRDGPECALGGIVGQADATVVDEAGEAGPTLEHEGGFGLVGHGAPPCPGPRDRLSL